jgi:hypothetical protein
MKARGRDRKWKIDTCEMGENYPAGKQHPSPLPLHTPFKVYYDLGILPSRRNVKYEQDFTLRPRGVQCTEHKMAAAACVRKQLAGTLSLGDPGVERW